MANAPPYSKLPYFRGKGQVEETINVPKYPMMEMGGRAISSTTERLDAETP